jgi:hypothetical protein
MINREAEQWARLFKGTLVRMNPDAPELPDKRKLSQLLSSFFT